jgi:hypothetical protein
LDGSMNIDVAINDLQEGRTPMDLTMTTEFRQALMVSVYAVPSTIHRFVFLLAVLVPIRLRMRRTVAVASGSSEWLPAVR